MNAVAAAIMIGFGLWGQLGSRTLTSNTVDPERDVPRMPLPRAQPRLWQPFVGARGDWGPAAPPELADTGSVQTLHRDTREENVKAANARDDLRLRQGAAWFQRDRLLAWQKQPQHFPPTQSRMYNGVKTLEHAAVAKEKAAAHKARKARRKVGPLSQAPTLYREGDVSRPVKQAARRAQQHTADLKMLRRARARELVRQNL